MEEIKRMQPAVQQVDNFKLNIKFGSNQKQAAADHISQDDEGVFDSTRAHGYYSNRDAIAIAPSHELSFLSQFNSLKIFLMTAGDRY